MIGSGMNVSGPCDAELVVMDSFLDQLANGACPDVEVFLQGCPEFAGTLRPVLEAAGMLKKEYQVFRLRHPGVDLGRVLRLK